MDETKIAEMLTAFLTDVANQAKADALVGQSNIGSVFDRDLPAMKALDEKKIKEAIADIRKATATKESCARLVDAILLAVKAAAITLK